MRSFLSRWVCVAFLCLIVPVIGAETKDVSATLQTILDRHKVPALAAVVIEGDVVVASAAVGVRRMGSPEKVTLNDRFHIGSCTKAMAATLCAMLVEEGKLSWGTTIAEAFPDLKGKIHPGYQSVTLEQLLAHRGGTPADLQEGGLWARLGSMNGVASRRALLEGVVTKAPATPPGEKYVYSNAGYAIAGHMAERVAKKAWEELMRERLFKPLGMASAGFGAPGVAAKVDQPRGHAADGKVIEPGRNADNPSAIGPAGTVHCTITDWAKFIALHVQGSDANPKRKARLLKPETFAKLQTPFGEGEPKYSMGWMVAERPWAGGVVLNHAGSNTMWYCVAWVAPKKDFAVLVTCNQAGAAGPKACDDAASAMIQEYLKGKR